jgi:D-alanyl-lipoteichoic acid acyltransferase DltB (MBOAT superfamily)
LVVFFAAGRISVRFAGAVLVLASFAFYSWWDPRFLPVLLCSIAFNYLMSEAIARTAKRPLLQYWLLVGAIAGNIGALAYFKYLSAVVDFLHDNGLFGGHLDKIALPLGISFFTFTQIGYLVDVKQGAAAERGFLKFLLFVTFFPHLIAGPILHHREIMPQFSRPETYRASARNIVVGLTIFIIGMVKKCLLADPTSVVVGPGFADAAHLPVLSAWNVALSYSLQLYFDFSGYSDMAIGIARMFNIRFPLNFNSPYKSASVIDYWQRWHMSLSRYLNLLLYNPISLAVMRHRAEAGLGTNKSAYRSIGGFSSMVLLPTLATMFLAGVWHGAGLQFMVFGVLHGIYLSINHAWRIFGPRPATPAAVDSPRVHVSKVLLTYGAVLIGAIFFRAPSCSSALDLLAGMIGLHGGTADAAALSRIAPDATIGGGVRQVAWVAMLYVIVWGAPNTQQIMYDFEPVLGKFAPPRQLWVKWRLNLPWAILVGLGAVAAMMSIGNSSEFLYFQF